MAHKSVVLSIVQILFFGGMLLAMWDLNHFVPECRLEKVIVKAGELIDECVYAVRRADWQR